MKMISIGRQFAMWREFFNTAAVYEIKSFDELLNVVKSEDHTLRRRVLIEFSTLSSFILDYQPWQSPWSMRYLLYTVIPPNLSTLIITSTWYSKLHTTENTNNTFLLPSPCYWQPSRRTPILGPSLTWLAGIVSLLPLLCLLLSPAQPSEKKEISLNNKMFSWQ